MSDFYKYFKENMDGLNLPTPESLFGSNQTAISTASVLLGMLEKFGRRVTIADLIVAGTKLERLSVVGAVNAAYYTGAVIGSIAVATGRTLSGGASLADVLLNAQVNHLYAPWLPGVLLKSPEIHRPELRARAVVQARPAIQ